MGYVGGRGRRSVGRRRGHHVHTVAPLANTVRLQQMVEKVLPGFEVFTANGARLPLGRRRVHISHVLLQIADAAVNATALFADRLRLCDSEVGAAGVAAAAAAATGTTSWNPTTARCH